MIPKIRLLQSFKKGINNATIRNIIIVGIITLLVKGLGFTKEIIIADNFGLSELLDTFYIAVLIPSFMSNVFLGGFKSVFIPNYVIELNTGKNIGSFQSTCFLVTFGVSIFFCLIALLVTDIYLDVFFKGHTLEYYHLVKTQFYVIIPSIIFWGISSLLNGLLNIDNEFTFSSLSSIFIPITIMVCIFFFKEELGTLVLAAGTLIGSMFGFIFLLTVALKRKIIHLKFPDFKSDNVKELFRQLPPKLAANILSGVNDIVDQYFAAALVVGSIAALNYGVKIPMFSIGIVTMALGNVLLPYFSKKAIENRVETFKKLKRILKLLIIGSSCVAIVLILLSTPIITLIFEHNAFTSSDTVIVSKIQQMYLLQIPAYIAGIIIVRFLEAINKNTFMVFAAIFSLLLNIGLNYLFMKIWGVYGLALSTSVVCILNTTILYLYVNHLSKKPA
ncbi:MAG: lipid II flippase MurJ [Gelidibacter sp.]